MAADTLWKLTNVTIISVFQLAIRSFLTSWEHEPANLAPPLPPRHQSVSPKTAREARFLGIHLTSKDQRPLV